MRSELIGFVFNLSSKRSVAMRFRTALAALLSISAACSTAAYADSSDQVERGKYLAIAGNCVSCHTSPGGEPMAGGLAFRTPFGTIYSTNITPDPQTGIGEWTQEDFARAVREGVRRDGAHLYPVFPYTSYTLLKDEDVAALFAYFKSLPPVRAAVPENELSFPYNQRWALGLWKMLYFDSRRFEPDRSKSEEWNRGAYLVEGLGHCGMCHSPRNFLGGQSANEAMTGGVYLDRVPSGEIREWAAPNLTSAPNGLASWPAEEIATYLKTGQNTFTQTFGPMNEVIMNSTRHLSDSDVQAMAVYLKELPPNPGPSGSQPSEQLMTEGSVLYDVHCGTCHMPTGLGDHDEDAGARLVGSPIVQASSPASLINIVLYGPERPNPPAPYRWKKMPSFANELTDEEIAAITTFVRNSWGNQAGAVTPKQVAAQR
jgi:mono/diheme cytochrome c family protein